MLDVLPKKCWPVAFHTVTSQGVCMPSSGSLDNLGSTESTVMLVEAEGWQFNFKLALVWHKSLIYGCGLRYCASRHGRELSL